MSVLLVITFTGPDKPGIVDELSGIVASHGGNWEESRMASLAGQFAGILKVCAPDEKADELLDALRATEESGLSVLVNKGTDVPALVGHQQLELGLMGADHEGIVKEVAHVLAERDVNILELNTEAYSAPMSGQQLFKAQALLDCPPSLSVDDLQLAVEKLAQDLMVTVELHQPK